MSVSPEEWITTPTGDEPIVDVGEGVGITSPAGAVVVPQHATFEIRQVIHRACEKCGGKTELELDGDKPRAFCPKGCGEAAVHDNGIVAATYGAVHGPADVLLNPIRNVWFKAARKPAANRRIRRANKQTREA